MVNVHLSNDIIINNNTGIRYELAMLLLLSNHDKKLSNFLKQREDSKDIEDIYNRISQKNTNFMSNFLEKAKLSDIQELKLTTQDDNVGPSDIVVNNNFGISIKWNNKCNFNPTGKFFLTRQDIHDFNSKLNELVKSYIGEMSNTYGPAINWFRQKHIRWNGTNSYINEIKSKVIHNWNEGVIDRRRVINKLFHLDSPIDYIIINITSDYKINFNFKFESSDFDESEIQLFDEPSTQYVLFKHKDVIIGKMQIKFNNGILERTNSKRSMILESIRIRPGRPLSSWNFNLA